MVRLLVTFLFLVSTYWVQAQSAQQAIGQAQTQLVAANYDSAILIIRPFINDEAAPQTKMIMALAYLRKQNYDSAIAYYTKALESSTTMARAQYQLGVTYARAGNNDAAFKHFKEALNTNQIDLTSLGTNPDLGNFTEDSRYGMLFPSAEEYLSPFVEDIQILRDWYGENSGDVFGWVARNIGDVDGDEINDVATSAPFYQDTQATPAGKIYVYSSGSGQLLWSAVGDSGATLGLGIDAAGDVNADGVPDLFAGAPGVNMAYIYSGIDGSLIHTFEGEHPGDRFGRDGKGVGDLNNDGYGDIVIGAPGYDKSRGAAYIYSGKDMKLLMRVEGEEAGDNFGTVAVGSPDFPENFIIIGAPNNGDQNQGRAYVFQGLNMKPIFTFDPEEHSVNLAGMFASVIGDVNNDGTHDIYLSDWAFQSKGPMTGSAYVYSGRDGNLLHRWEGDNGGDGFGIGIADAGDTNKDGFDDIAIGSWQFSAVSPSGGKVTVYSGKDGEILQTITGKVMGETLGFDTTGIGDIDGDGVIDLLLTSAYSAVNGTRSGRVLIISSKSEN